MLRSIVLGIYFWLLMILTLIVFVFYYLIRIFSKKFSSYFLMKSTKFWASHILSAGGIKINAKGLENLPKENNVCFISNHQSYLDIPVIYAVIPKQVGFVAKKELDRIPLLNLWMRALGCVLIDRKKRSDALKKTQKRIDRAEKGRPLVLFPEGTRSRGNQLRKFKTGSLHYMAGRNIKIIPLTIVGTHELLEKHKKIKKGQVDVYIHPPVKHDDKDPKALVSKLEEIIGGVFINY